MSIEQIKLSELNTQEISNYILQSIENCRSNPQEGIAFANKTIQNNDSSSSLKAQATIYKGACQVWIGDYQKAIKNLLESVQFIDVNNKEFEAHAIYHVFCAFYFLADYPNALKYAFELLNKAETNNNQDSQANALNAIGSVYYTINENEKAIEVLKKGLVISTKLSNNNLSARILDGLGTAHYNLSNIKESIEYKQKSLEHAQLIGSKNIESFALSGLAKIYVAANEFKKAEELFLECLKLREDLNFTFGIADTNSQLGHLYLQINDLEKAQHYLQSALGTAIQSNTKELIYKTHKLLADLFEKQDNKTELINHLKEYIFYKDAFFNEKNQQKTKGLEVEFNVSKIEKEKELLHKKNEQLESLSKDLIVLSDLGKTIISQLSVEAINNTVYQIINNIMDAHGFGIGVLSDNNENLFFPGYIEDGENVGSTEYNLLDTNRLAVICFNQQKEIIINDFNTEATNYIKVVSKPTIGKSTNSILYIPLNVANKKTGVLTVQSFNKNAFTPYQVNFVKNLAVYCSIALENANLYNSLEKTVEERTKEVVHQKEEIEKSYDNTRLLSIIGQQIISNINIESIFEELHKNVNKLMNADCFSIRIYNEALQEIHYKYTYEKGKLLEPISVSMSNFDNYSVWCVANKKEIFINDNLTEYINYTSKIVVPTGEMPSSLLFCPMMIGEKVTGVITVQSFSKNAYKPSDMDVLKTLATYTGIALENAALVETLEEKVNNRTAEILTQKEQLEQNFKNIELIGEIGKEISSALAVQEITKKVYQKTNSIMDATIFGIGVYRPEQNDIYFSGAIENGEELNSYSYGLTEDKIAIQCFKNNKEFFINDWEKEYKKYVSSSYSAVVGNLPESMIYMPLISKDKTIGVITVQSFQKNKYNEYHVDVLRNLSVYVANAIENANLYKGLEKTVEERTKEVVHQKEEIEISHQNTRLLASIGQQIISTVNFDSIFKNLHENISKLMNADCFGVRIYHPSRNVIEYRYEIEKGELIQDSFNASMDNIDNYSVWCVTNKKEIFINDNLNEYQKYTKKIVVPSGDMPNSLVFCPMMIGDRILGVITVQSFEKFAYKPLHIDILKTLGTYTAIALENASLVENLEEKVKERTSEVVKQKEIIEETNKHITDSIKYAKRIQDAFLPNEKSISEYLKNAFIFYKPKDIVSGDFYWFERKENKILFAVVDCTGHGVPGAFMSIIGFNGLNQIVNEYNITKPSDILNHLNKNITNTLRQTVEDSKIRDGMDIAICSLDLSNNTLEFAGAYNPLFIIRNNELVKFKGDKHPIGNFINEQEYEFTNHEITLFPDDKIYIFSDGFADQFGGLHGKKMKYNHFRNLLLQHHQKNMKEQKTEIAKFFDEWSSGYEQIDDVCLIGIAI